MSDQFFEKPILNSPYEYPARHWELDGSGQPTQQIAEQRRVAEFVTPIPKPRRRRGRGEQEELVFEEGRGLSTAAQQYDVTGNVSEIRRLVDAWRQLPNPNELGGDAGDAAVVAALAESRVQFVPSVFLSG